MPKVFRADFPCYYEFKIPKTIFLLDEFDPKNDDETPGSWWIKWATFYYIDKDGVKQEIEGIDCSDLKRPNNIEQEDEETDEEDNADIDEDGFVKCGNCVMGGGNHATEDCPTAPEKEDA